MEDSAWVTKEATNVYVSLDSQAKIARVSYDLHLVCIFFESNACMQGFSFHYIDLMVEREYLCIRLIFSYQRWLFLANTQIMI